MNRRPAPWSLVLVAALAACGDAPSDGRKHVRVGHFPNVTHAQGLVAHGLTRAGKGWFEERLGPDVAVDWYTFNAGPSAMEALLAGSIDVTYVGPSPALNAHVKSAGHEVRIVSGAARGGAALVVQGDGRIKSPADFRGKKVATPQPGNTQDVACRAWLTAQGFKVTQTGGDVTVVPTENPNQLPLFVKGDLDAAWTVEPWVSRLEREGGGKVFFEEKDAVTTVLVASAGFLERDADTARRFVKAHEELTKWLVDHGDEAKAKVRAEIAEETKKEMPAELLAQCWPRLRFDTTIAAADLESYVKAAQAAGFLKDAGDLSRLVQVDR
jgi:NitT/TauT family transport system substrate-binding protein